MPIVMTRQEGYGFESYAKIPFTGLPLIHIGMSNKVVTRGVLAIGVFSVGFISLGWISVGGAFAIGQLAVSSGVAIGQLAPAIVIGVGQFSCGIITLGMLNIGIFYRALLGIGIFGNNIFFNTGGSDFIFDDVFERWIFQPNILATIVFYVIFLVVLVILTAIGEVIYFIQFKTIVRADSAAEAINIGAWFSTKSGTAVTAAAITSANEISAPVKAGSASISEMKKDIKSESSESEAEPEFAPMEPVETFEGKKKRREKAKPKAPEPRFEPPPVYGDAPELPHQPVPIGDSYFPAQDAVPTAPPVAEYSYGASDTYGTSDTYAYNPYASEAESDFCNVCYTNKKDMVFLPCGHVATCEKCSKQIMETNRECPLCREHVNRAQKVFF